MIGLLISGSRNATKEMLDYAASVVTVANRNKFIILVGDAPGIDQVVVETCTIVNAVCICVGITKDPRNGGAQNLRSTYKHLKNANYTARDRHMVERAAKIICIWDGKSKGTKAVYDYAQELGKPVLLKTFQAKETS